MLEVILFVDRYSHNRRWKAHVVGALSRNISARWKLIACSTTSYRILIPLHWLTNTGQPLSSRPSRLIGETEIRFEGRASRLRSSTGRVSIFSAWQNVVSSTSGFRISIGEERIEGQGLKTLKSGTWSLLNRTWWTRRDNEFSRKLSRVLPIGSWWR